MLCHDVRVNRPLKPKNGLESATRLEAATYEITVIEM
jgi:hypothetical protein